MSGSTMQWFVDIWEAAQERVARERFTARLARALCVTSWHGNLRMEWPCSYHEKRAAATVAKLLDE